MGFEPARLIDRLEAFPGLLSALLGEARGAEWTWRPDGGGWALVEILGHLLREEREDFRPRLRLTLDSPGSPWPPIDPEGAVIAGRDIEGDPAGMLGQFIHERRASVDWLRGLGVVDWGRLYRHPTIGAIRAGDLLAAWADHDSLHARQIIKRRHQRTELDAGGYSCRYAGEWTA